jgi:hypothetical protein
MTKIEEFVKEQADKYGRDRTSLMPICRRWCMLSDIWQRRP